MNPDVLIRSFALVRGASTEDGRTLSIRAVPWDTEIQIGPGTVESFDPHSFDGQLRAANRVKLTLGHPKPGDLLTNSLIGSLSAMEARSDGLHVQARMATSTVANEALTLVNDGVIDQVSIGFIDVRTDRSRRGDTTVLRRTAARLDHLALVGAGAYGDGAKVLAVRDNDGPSLADLREMCARLSVH
jgi:uncharacterized protein